MAIRQSIIGLWAGLGRRSCRVGVLFALWVALFPSVGQAQFTEWAVSAGGVLSDTSSYIAVDGTGNSYVTGRFDGTATFGSFALTSAGESDVFVAKYDTTGNVLWAQSGEGSEGKVVFGIGVDAAGNSYVTGTFQGTVTFAPFALASAGDWGIYLVKYDTGGNVLWAQSAEGSVWDSVGGLAVDAAGNSYVTGEFADMATFGSFTLTSAGGRDVFVVKYDSGGNVSWARSGGGTAKDQTYDIAVDTADNCYITGGYRGPATFGSVTLPTTADSELFLAKYDAGGNVLWAQSAGTIDGAVYAIAADPVGNSYVTGAFFGTATFGSFTLTSVGNHSIFVVKYDTGGNVLWARSAGGPPHWSKSLGIAVDEAGISHVTGEFENTATFGAFTLTSAGFFDMFLAEYDGDGNVLWVDSAGGPPRCVGNDVALDAAGNPYVTGTFGEGTATFGHLTLTSAGDYDVFVTKYGPGACCLADTSCVQLAPVDCVTADGTYVGGVCDGDVDGDGLDAACGDPCPYDNPDDTDGDGVCDSDDPCPNDNPDDTDGDGACDSDDPCPLDNPDDTDGDGVCESVDACPGFDDNADEDDDGIPDGCDGCPLDPGKAAPGVCGCGVPDEGDADGDGVLDCIDQCLGVDDAVFGPECVSAIPTVSAWGLVILVLLILTGAKLVFVVRRGTC